MIDKKDIHIHDISSCSIHSFRLNNFRNFTRCYFDIQQRITALCGYNGVGKTNILDAISRISLQRGIKNQTHSECVNMQYPHEGWGMGVVFDNGDIIKIGKHRNQDKTIYHYNNNPLNQTQLQQLFPILWLTPVGERLFTQEHKEIRSYIDDLIGLCFPEFGQIKHHYTKALKQRMIVLQNYQDNDWLKTLEHEIAYNAIQIIGLRKSFLELTEKAYYSIKSDTIKGLPDFSISIECDSNNYTQSSDYADKLYQMRSADKSASRSLFGVHRGRIHVMNHDKNIDIFYCSTGEQKAIITHLLLVINHILLTNYRKKPIILLDDCFAHYDKNRIGFLTEYMCHVLKNQIFISHTEFNFNNIHHQHMNVIDINTIKDNVQNILI